MGSWPDPPSDKEYDEKGWRGFLEILGGPSIGQEIRRKRMEKILGYWEDPPSDSARSCRWMGLFIECRIEVSNESCDSRKWMESFA